MHPSATDLSSTARPSPPSGAQAAFLARCIRMVADDLADAETRLRELMHSDVTVIPDAAGHLAFAGGKRLRPLLALLCAKATGVTDPHRITVAAVGELLHTATLLHDDVIDEGEFRRGRPCPRIVHGNGISVLTGDFCLSRSLQAVANTGHIDAVQSMADTVMRMAEGEVAQLYGAGGAALDRAHYDMIIERKTATLIAWCAMVGCFAPLEFREPLRRFGLELGYAFQIADDLLDYGIRDASAPGETGKIPGQDLREGKWTLPLLIACEDDPALHDDVLAAFGDGPPLLDDAANDIMRRVMASDGVVAARTIADRHADAAAEALAPLPPGDAKEALQQIPNYVVRRTH
jgi:octaprenyl-diphosphate synthase